ncbi:MAG: putative DNA binding domain-containing protein [Planctomycetota bacterium]|nr:putative DNA binding domain-containing protein [Planctomycetota bacterium]
MNYFQKRLFDPDTLEGLLPKAVVHPSLEPPAILSLMSVDEIFSEANQELLECLREDNRVERKPASFHSNQLTEYVVMWANTPPDGGLLVMGMHDDGSWEGCSKLEQKALNRLEHPQSDLGPEAPECETRRIPVTNKNGTIDFVVLIRVKHSRRKRVIRTAKGDVFTRRGDSKKKLTPDEIRNLQIDIGEVDFEQEPCGLEYPDKFDCNAIHGFCETIRALLELSPVTDEDILTARHLGDRKGQAFIPNFACALLFGLDIERILPGCKIRFLRYDGLVEGSGERFNAVKDVFIEGTPVPKLIHRAEEVLEAQIRTFSTLGKDGRFYTQSEYPKAAWYEAIVNACVHRSYGNGLRNMMIFVKMFDDRLEIESPGGFLPFVTPETIYGQSCPRNPMLMQAMYYLKFVKMAAEGTRRMRDTMTAMGLPVPEFSQKEIEHSRVRVTLRNDIQHRTKWVDNDAIAIVGAAIARGLTDSQKRMINFVAEHKAINVTQAVRLTGLDWVTAKKALSKLETLGILRRIARDDIDRDPLAKYVFSTPEE